MGRTPVSEISALQTRAALWAAIRAFRWAPEGVEEEPVAKSFTAQELRKETCCSISQVQEYLTGLTNAGILARKGSAERLVAHTYLLIRDLGIEPPRVRRDGTQVTQGFGREQMWRTMRMLKEFTALDLSVQASTEEAQVQLGTAKEYCLFLAYAGYLAIVRQGKGCGSGGYSARYRFVPSRYTGPLPPMIQKVKNVFDPNLNQVVWSGEEARHDAE